MFRSSGGSDSNDTTVITEKDQSHQETLSDIDPKDPKANEAAKIIQQAYRKHHEHQDSCNKQQQDMSSQ